jgi:polyhydroxyalkanoate synthesis regulator phasin
VPAIAEVVDDAGTDEAAQKKKSLAALREWVDHSKHRLEDWQKQVEEKARGALENIQHAVNPWAGVNKDVKVLADRIAELEAKLHELEAHEAADADRSG